jgi:formiminotetrahydrofolate cyclodeaminase
VFDKVMGAYEKPCQTDEEKAVRSEAIKRHHSLAHVICGEVMELSKAVAEKRNLNVINDAGAVLAAHAALRSAALPAA